MDQLVLVQCRLSLEYPPARTASEHRDSAHLGVGRDAGGGAEVRLTGRTGVVLQMGDPPVLLQSAGIGEHSSATFAGKPPEGQRGRRACDLDVFRQSVGQQPLAAELARHVCLHHSCPHLVLSCAFVRAEAAGIVGGVAARHAIVKLELEREK